MEPNTKSSIKGKQFTGTVVSTGMLRTVIVSVEQYHRHPLYKKAIRRTRKFAVDIGAFTLAKGETVIISETKPMSKTKHFVVIEKIS